jgi:hypothetical protein
MLFAVALHVTSAGRAVLVALAANSVALGCSSSTRDYGQLACLDAYPPAPPPGAPRAALTIAAPSIAWQTSLGNRGYSRYRGVALSGEHIVTSAGPDLVALERSSGAQAFEVAVSQNSFMALGPPAVDGNGGIHVQSPAGVSTLAADGTQLGITGPGGYWREGDPPSGSGWPLTILDGNVVLAWSTTGQAALDATAGLLWQTEFGAHLTMGHWGFGNDGVASYVVDLRSGEPAGRLHASDRDDVLVLAPLAGRGVLATKPRIGADVRILLLDACGQETWSTTIRSGCGYIGGGVVGPGEITYFMTESCDNPSDVTIVGLGPDGQIAAGPAPLAAEAIPWLVGADGTVYAVAPSYRTSKTHLSALTPALAELWSLELDGVMYDPSAVLTEDGVLYARLLALTGESVIAIQTASPGLAASSWPMAQHDNQATRWGGGPF